MAGDQAVMFGDPGGRQAAGGDPAAGVGGPARETAADLVHTPQHGDAADQVQRPPGSGLAPRSRPVRPTPFGQQGEAVSGDPVDLAADIAELLSAIDPACTRAAMPWAITAHLKWASAT